MINNLIEEKRLKKIQRKAEFALKCSDTKNPLNIANALGIKVCTIDLKSVKAFIAGTSNEETIYIDEKLTSYSKKIVCAHELGHYFLNSNNYAECFDSEIDSYNEFEANLFVMYLMPQVFTRMDFEKINSIEQFNSYVEQKVLST